MKTKPLQGSDKELLKFKDEFGEVAFKIIQHQNQKRHFKKSDLDRIFTIAKNVKKIGVSDNTEAISEALNYEVDKHFRFNLLKKQIKRDGIEAYGYKKHIERMIQVGVKVPNSLINPPEINKILMKTTYKKVHTLKKAADSHAAKVIKRGGKVKRVIANGKITIESTYKK